MSKLIIVPTPVGNLEDITFRALQVLRDVHLILAEDTRITSRLLGRYDISTSMIPHHQHNEHKTLAGLMNKLKAGQTMALVSDAGTPGVSDPGFLLVRECLREGVEVECLPGATAFIPALVCSGLPCDRFCFEGFLPVKKGRQARLAKLKDEDRTMVFYESPYRLLKTLLALAEVLGEDRQASVAREISKIHEQHIRGTLAELVKHFEAHSPRGECTLVVEGSS